MIWVIANWKWLIGAATSLVLGLALGLVTIQRNSARASLKAEIAAHQLDISNWRRASEQARADNLAHVRAVEQRQAAITEEHNVKIADAAARYRALAADYARLHKFTGTPARGGGEAHLPEAPDASGGTDTALAQAIVPASDLGKCADLYAIAEGWQSWWRDVSAVER